MASAISGAIAALSLIVVAVTSLTPFRPPDWVVIGAFWLMLIGIAAAVVPELPLSEGRAESGESPAWSWLPPAWLA